MYNQVHRLIYLGAIIFLSTAWIFVGCKSKNNETETIVVDDNAHSEWLAFKKSTEKSIANNDERIKTLQEKIKKSSTPKLDTLRQARIDALEEQNAELRSKIMEYKEDELEYSWQEYKSDVQQQLDKIEQELKDLDNNNDDK